MRVFPRYLLVLIALYGIGIFSSANAQYVQTNDQVAIRQLTNITNVPASQVRGVSDDGNRIVFESSADITGGNPDNNNEIFLYDVTTRKTLQVTNTQHIYDPADADKPFYLRKILVFISNNYPALSGDGTKIVFGSNSSNIIPGSAGANDDHNQEIYIATIPIGSSTPTFQRVTNTPATTVATGVTEVFDNYTPTVNYNGSVVAFVTVTNSIPGVTNPDGIDQIILFNPANGKFTQVTTKNEADAIDTFFNYKGFNTNPQLNGDGTVLAWMSGFNHAPTSTVNNSDFNGELFTYDISSKAITQITNTTGFAGYPAGQDNLGRLVPNTPLNAFSQATKHLSNDGNLMVFESAADLETGKNTTKVRQVFLYNRTTKKFTQITANIPVPTTITAAVLATIDFNYSPGISPDGKFVFFSSILNVVPVASGTTSDVSTDNADGSKEVFRYKVSDGSFRQVTYTAASSSVLDQRDNLIAVNSNLTGDRMYFTYQQNITGDNIDTSAEIFMAQVSPITSTNPTAAAVVNAASYYVPDTTTPANNPVPEGSIAAVFGTQLANSTASATRGDLDFSLAGTTVSLGGIACKLFFVSPTQINFLIPNGVGTTANAPLLVNNNGVVSKGTFKLVDAYPGIFTLSQNGSGKAAYTCQLIKKDANGAVLSNTYVAPPCQVSSDTQDSYLLLFGTGLRNAAAGTVGLTVTNNGTDVVYTPDFSGEQGFFLGLDQINLKLTKDFAIGDSTVVVKLTNSSGSVTSNTFTITTVAAQKAEGPGGTARVQK